MAFLGKMQRDHGGFESSGSAVARDEAESDPGLEQRGGVGMSEGMDGHTGFGNAGAAFGFAEGPLDAVSTHGCSGAWALFLIASGGREEPGGVVVGFPVGSEPRQGLRRERDVPVLGALASVDMAREALAVNGGNLQVESFMEPESQAVDRGKVDVIVQGCGRVEEPPDLLDTEDSGKAMLGLSAKERQGVPITLENVLIEEADGAVADTHGRGGEVVAVLSVQEVVLQLGFGEQRGSAVELGEQADFPDVSVWGAFALATELKCRNPLLTQRGHEISPFVSGRDVC